MSRKAEKTNVKTAQKLNSKTLTTIPRVLISIGKPFYLALSVLVIGFLSISYWAGRFTRFILIKPFSLLLDLFRSAKNALPKLKIPALKFRLKLLRLPRIRLKKVRIIYKRPRVKKRYAFILLALIAFFSSYWYFILRGLPSPEDLITRDQEVSTKIYDRNGLLLYNIFKDQNRTIVPLDQIPLQVQLATLAAEDAEFYTHPGFSVRGMLRALVRNATQEELSGGSTITQQLVKNALLTSEKTIIRKIREIVLAIGVERTFTKDQILEMYLNEVSYGGIAYGIQEASRIYFGKDVGELTLSEAALLAGLPKSPTRFSPFGPSPEEGVNRQKDVIRLMRINKFISIEQEEKALTEKLSFAPNKTDILAPHFVMYVRQILEETYGPEVVEQGGLEVTTTLDYEVQLLAEETVKNEVERLARLNVGNGAALVLDPKTGEILAMVGSKDYFDTEADGNVNVTTALRQPGSSIKLVNYAYILSNGSTPATIVSDSPVSFSIPGQPVYSPKNYDSSYRGNLSLRSAFAESRNVPAVKILASYGVEKMIEMGQRFGITTWDEKGRFGLSLTLGGGEVKLTELAKAYATVANYGNKPELSAIMKITNYKGTTLEKNGCTTIKNPLKDLISSLVGKVKAAETFKDTCDFENVLDARVAFQLIDILSDNVARSPAFGSRSLLNIPQHPEVAVKTGTSNNLRDNLAIGFNQDYLVATWVGNNDNSPMARVASGITGATPIFNRIMSALLADKESVAWETPEGVIQTTICSLTGSLPCRGCPTRAEWFLEETVPTRYCSSETIAEIKKEGSKQSEEGQLLPEAASTQQ